MTWSCRLDCIYFFVALGIYIATYKSKERMQKAKKTMKYDYSYDTKEVDTINQKPKKKFKFKTINDRLYDEAVNYFGKDSIKNRDKAAVIEDYLNEEGSMWKK